MTTMVVAPVPPSAPVLFGAPKLCAEGEIAALSFATDGSLWSVEEPGVLRHWNVRSGTQLGWRCLSDLETVWAFSRDARILASGSDDLTLWNTASGQIMAALPQEAWVTALALGKNKGHVATGHEDGVIRYWDAVGQRLLNEWAYHDTGISALAISRDGRFLAAAAEDCVISLWDLAQGNQIGILEGHTDRIPALAWHPSGAFLVSAGWDATARVWDVSTQSPVILLNSHAGQVTALAFNEDGRRLASADAAASVHLWDFDAKKTLHILFASDGDVPCLAFAPDGKTLAAGGEKSLHLWDTATGKVLAGAGPHALIRTSLALSPDGTRLLTNGGGATPQVGNVATGQISLNLHAEEPVHAVAASPDGKLWAGALEKRLRLWDAATGRVLRDCEGPQDPITLVAFSPDSMLLASAGSSGTGVWIWRVHDGEPILLIPDALDNCTISSLAFHPDGRRLAIGGIDWLATGGSAGAVSIWDLEERCEIVTFSKGATAIAFHPSGQVLGAATTEQTICFWDVDNQELLTEISGHEGAGTFLAFSPDGRWLASGGEDHILRLANADGEERALHELDSRITALAFSADSRFIYTAHANTTCRQLRIRDLLQ